MDHARVPVLEALQEFRRAPGELITAEAIDYLTSGTDAGMLIPDAADTSLTSLRVVAT